MEGEHHRDGARSIFFHHRPVRATAAVFALAALSFSAWRFEVEFVKGWTGLNWLHGYPWAAPAICIFVALSVLTVVAEAISLRWVEGALFTGLVAFSGWLAFEITRRWFEDDPSWIVLVGGHPSFEHWLFSPFLSLVITAVAIHRGLRLVGLDLAWWTLLLFFAAPALVWPVSWLSIELVPAHGYRDSIHAVKAGYPAFWINVLLAVTTAIAIRFGVRREAPPSRIAE